MGNFIGMLPDSMAESKVYGVELDSISGRIASQLYQNSSISVNGFEKVQMPDSFFDVAIGNVPFGDFKVRDKRYDKNHWLIHDYFFGKTLDKVRPGGIVGRLLPPKAPWIRKTPLSASIWRREPTLSARSDCRTMRSRQMRVRKSPVIFSFCRSVTA